MPIESLDSRAEPRRVDMIWASSLSVNAFTLCLTSMTLWVSVFGSHSRSSYLYDRLNFVHICNVGNVNRGIKVVSKFHLLEDGLLRRRSNNEELVILFVRDELSEQSIESNVETYLLRGFLQKDQQSLKDCVRKARPDTHPVCNISVRWISWTSTTSNAPYPTNAQSNQSQ